MAWPTRNTVEFAQGGQNMRNQQSVFSILAALALAACSASDTRQADAQALKDNEARWNQDFAAKDVDKLAAHYAENAILMGPGAPSAAGKTAIRNMLANMIADPALSLQFQSARVEVAKGGDMAYTQGTYRMTMTD